ncbi:protein kinase domain-containing protein [Aspergillus affinis]|uniref:protein kinase domain-containing protein n=1 Tax=Aspergillus affinis TaxID=1070780 RepID=UPI0022FDE0C6|nr:kinase-like protein [Aspergillus affinis]KAI9036743.1 kinase-like protein [Aspergillus affinis]
MKLLSLVLFPLQCLFVCFRHRKPQQRIQGPVAEPEDIPEDERPFIAAPVVIRDSKGLCPPSMCREASTASSRSVQTEPDYKQLNPALTHLRNSLREAVLECPVDGYKLFIPTLTLKRLIDEDTVRSILKEGSLLALDRIEETTRHILQHSRKLFAILVDRDKTCCISDFLEEGIDDEDLPFIRRSSVGEQTLTLETSQRRRIKTFESWDRESLKTFENEQYRMLAPLLEVKTHHEFTELQTLPYIALSTADPQEDTSAEGGYGEVFQACIHPDHHNFWEYPTYKGQGLLVAVKRLYSSQESSFTAERQFHEALGTNHPHVHVIDLLFTYKKGGKYHLVFPWADGSLRKYWQGRPTPPFDVRTLLWSLKQMAGVASGLSLIHQFNDGTLFGRHGDIKADNILWFARLQDYDDEDGILQIADMGLASVHRLGSRSNVNPASITVPSTYSPPDAFRGRRISRAWDMWSLGCMYLEFVTWIVLGYEAIEDFANWRGNDDDNLEFSSDCFYMTDHQGIRTSVFEWVDHLRSQERCSAVIHDLLDLIMGDMIVLEPQLRSSSQSVWQKLNEIFRTAEKNREYLLKSMPVPADRPLLDEYFSDST